MAVEMLGYIEKASPIHRLTGTTKLIGFLLFTTATMFTYDSQHRVIPIVTYSVSGSPIRFDLYSNICPD